MDFVTKSFRKDETLTSWPLLQHICPHFWTWLLNTIAITPKSEDKYVVKVVNWSEFHLSEMTLLQNRYFRWSTNMFIERQGFSLYEQSGLILPHLISFLEIFYYVLQKRLFETKYKCIQLLVFCKRAVTCQH